MHDRYTKIVLTVIAGALVYLCIVLTPLPGVQAQTALRPGDPTGPAEMVIVGWRLPPGAGLPVSVAGPVSVVTGNDPLRIIGRVNTERSEGAADRMVIVGWEENAVRERTTTAMQSFTRKTPGLPVVQRTAQ